MAGSLREKRAAQMAARGQPLKPGTAQAPGMVEPPQAAVPPAVVPPVAAPPAAAPRASEGVPVPAARPAPASAPAPAASPSKGVPPLVAPPVATPAEKRAGPPPMPVSPGVKAAPAAPAPAPQEDEGSGAISLRSSEIDVEEEGTDGESGEGPTREERAVPVVPAPQYPAAAPTPAPQLGSGFAPLEIPREETPGADPLAQLEPLPPRELKRTESGKVAFARLGDNGTLPCKYKLSYVGDASASSCNFLLIGKGYSQTIELALNEPAEIALRVKGGREVKMTLTYTGVSRSDGAKEVEYRVEGGISAVTGIFERVRSIGPATVSALRSLATHLPETITLGFAGTLAICGFAINAVAEKLGSLHPYVTVAVPAVIAGLGAWAWAERNKAIRRESEQ